MHVRKHETATKVEKMSIQKCQKKVLNQVKCKYKERKCDIIE